MFLLYFYKLAVHSFSCRALHFSLFPINCGEFGKKCVPWHLATAGGIHQQLLWLDCRILQDSCQGGNTSRENMMRWGGKLNKMRGSGATGGVRRRRGGGPFFRRLCEGGPCTNDPSASLIAGACLSRWRETCQPARQQSGRTRQLHTLLPDIHFTSHT